MNTVAHVEYDLKSQKYLLIMRSESLATTTEIDVAVAWALLHSLHLIQGGLNPTSEPDVKLRCYSTKSAGALLFWTGDVTSLTANIGATEIVDLKNSCITALLRAGEEPAHVISYT